MAVDTIPSLFLHAVKTHFKSNAFQYKKSGRWFDVSHEDVLAAVDKTSLGLLASNLAKGDRIAVLSENRLEWAIADLAILSAGCITVPIYATLPAQQIEYVLRDSESRAVFVSTKEQLDKILSVRANLRNLLHIITFDAVTDEEGIMTLEQLGERGGDTPAGSGYEERIATIGKYDWASIIYTSGTTGDPKGVILNHWNFVSNVMSALSCIDVDTDDRCLSFLPLSHVFERTGGYYAMLYAGVTIAYAEGIDAVPQNLLEVSPTVMVSVPRLYEKMYQRILDAVHSGSAVKKGLFFWSVAAGKKYVQELLENRVKRTTRAKYHIASKLVFRKLKARTGGRLRFFVSGGAPLARDIAEFFYAAGIPILEGYGLTETSPVITVNTMEHFKFGTVGRPLPGVQVQIADDGEILARGPNIMLGYYKKPDLTDEVLDGEWFHTGDIGYIDDDGFLVITDRKKDIIVTAGGKNVAPQPLENLLITNKYISQVLVVGNKRKFISAIIVPNFENLKKFATAAGISYSNESDLVKNPKVIGKYHDEIEEKSEHLASFERVKKFILLDREFSIEGNELTPTLKVKRAAVERELQKDIDLLYES